jgi:phosphatidylserine/phosphatidylglycerophosphate/cardiolipin synthase-like enzyme
VGRKEAGEKIAVKLIIQPDDGITPLLMAVKRAKKTIDIVIFRFDRVELEKALAQAVGRGVAVRALVAQTNRGGEKRLRKLEMTFLEKGVTVCRTADDLTRYHGKMMIVDGELYILGFNYTEIDINRSRSFGVITREAALVKAASALFEADATRQPYEPISDRFVVSPESSRRLLSAFIRGAKKELLIYDPKISDKMMVKLLRERAAAGVSVKVIGQLTKNGSGIEVTKLPGMRLHARAIVRDRKALFLGSQSLRRLQIDGRREIGVIAPHVKVATAVARVFEQDWEKREKKAGKAEKEKKKVEKKDEKKPDKVEERAGVLAI